MERLLERERNFFKMAKEDKEEWVELLNQARLIGLTPSEIRAFLDSKNKN